MVLKKFAAIILLLYFLCSQNINAQDRNYWNHFFQTAFENSSEINDIKKDYISAIISKKQYDYHWFPNLQVALQNTTSASRGDYIPVLNKQNASTNTSASRLTWLTSPATSFAISQRLPGGGELAFGAGYGFNYSFEHKAFLQRPEIQLSLNQLLSRGAFGITKNPEYQLMKEQKEYSELVYKIKLNSELINILQLIKNADILYSQEQYYEALMKKYESELNTAKEKAASGMQSNLQTHYAEHQYSEAMQKLNDIRYEKDNIKKEIEILVPQFNFKDIDTNRIELIEMILKIYNSIEPIETEIENNSNVKIYSSILKQYLFQYRTNEINYAPEFFLNSSITPNSSVNANFSDWYKSFRIFKENKNPFDFSVTMGVRKKFEFPAAMKKRKEIYELNKNAVETEFTVTQNTQKRELKILLEDINNKRNYLQSLETELQTEQFFRENRLNLYEQNLITQDDFLQSETIYFQIYSDYIKTLWECMENQINVINLCSSTPLLLNTFLEDTYEN
ncbi:MAG: hypothetical protein K6A89_11410 [Treponema sp.]|nr:hypothetical protein [Treponema sp.]